MPTKENSSLPLLISPRLEGENNREYAYRVLRQNIITLQFAPGQTLSEAELSEKLEMSRPPVHEAVMMLKNEWLVDVQAQRGSSVSMIRVDYLREGFNMRLMLEASIMQQLAGRLTMQQPKPFAACIEAQAKVAKTGNYETPGQEFVSLDNDFHQLLYQGITVNGNVHCLTDRLAQIFFGSIDRHILITERRNGFCGNALFA